MKITKVVIIFLLILFNVAHSKDIYWYLAASMTKPAKEIVESYNKKGKDKMFLITGGSGELLSKIYASKRGDLYTPADERFLKKAIQLGVIKKYKPLLIQEPVLAFAKNSKVEFDNISNICEANVKIALGNPETMAMGKIFESMQELMPPNIYNCIKEKKTVDPLNISQTVNYLINNVVDVGMLFKSTAKINKLKYIEIPTQWNVKEKAYLSQLIYTKDIKATEAAIQFIEKNLYIFERNGYDIIK